MSTKKYIILIVLGLFLTIGLGYFFINIYKQKNQTTSSLVAIPQDVVAAIKITNPKEFFNSNKNTFYSGLENPLVMKLMSRIGASEQLQKLLNSSLIISFHPVGKDRLEPLVILRSPEQLSQSKIENFLKEVSFKIKEIEYNSDIIYQCSSASKEIIYLAHRKGVTVISPSLILIQSSCRQLDGALPINLALKTALNATNSSSNASIVINTKAILPWLKNRILTQEPNLAAATLSLCSWLTIDYQQGNDEITFSGILSTNENTPAGIRLAQATAKELLTPSVINDNNAFCLEYNFKMSNLLTSKKESSDRKEELLSLISAITPERVMLEHVTSKMEDTAGFAAILFPANLDSTLHKLRKIKSLHSLSTNTITELKLDSSSYTLQKILGAPFSLVHPKYILIRKDRVMLSSIPSLLSQLQSDQEIAALRSGNPTADVWSNKITSNGVAALYINPTISKAMLSSLINPLVQRSPIFKFFEEWNGLGITVTPNGSNLVVSGYISRKKAQSTATTRYFSSSINNLHPAVYPRSDGSTLIAIALHDSLAVLDGKLHLAWCKKLSQKIDSIVTIPMGDVSLIAAIGQNAITFFNEKGTRLSEYHFNSKPFRIVDRAFKSSLSEIAVIDGSNNVFMMNPSAGSPAKKLFKLGYKPSQLIFLKDGNQPIFISGRGARSEVINTKGSTIKRIPIALEQAQAVVMDKKIAIATPRKSMILSSHFVPIRDKMSSSFDNIRQLQELTIASKHLLFTLSSKNVKLYSKEMESSIDLPLVSTPTYVRALGGKQKEFIIADSNGNIYRYNTKGHLADGYPINVGQSRYVITASDGTLFAVSIGSNKISSKEISADLSSLL